jgi:hypothetical protein
MGTQPTQIFAQHWYHIINFMAHNLIIIVMQTLLFVGSYGINMNVIHLFVLFEHQYHAHCLDTNVICLFILLKHECCMSIFCVQKYFYIKILTYYYYYTLKVESAKVNFRLPLTKIFFKINISSIRSLLCFFGQSTI